MGVQHGEKEVGNGREDDAKKRVGTVKEKGRNWRKGEGTSRKGVGFAREGVETGRTWGWN